MTHLKIELNNGVIEEVSSAVIDKLYDIVHSGNLDNTSNLIGRLHTTATYQDYIDYLEDTFKVNGVKLLIIDATKKYLTFADPVVASYWANSTYGDGTGLDSTAANSVLSIPNDAFLNNTSLQTFNELSSFVNCSSLGSKAFCECTSLTSIDISNVTNISNQCFSASTALTTIGNFNTLITSIPYGCFDSCTSLVINDLNLPNLTTLNSFSFKNTKVKLVSDLGSITSVLNQTFYGCSQLTSVVLPNTVTTIGDGAFGACSALTSIDLSNITSLGNLAFYGCSSLLSVTLGNSITTIGNDCFNGCTSLSNVGDTSNVTSLGDKAFYGCSGLTSLDFSNVTSISFSGGMLENRTFLNCSALQYAYFPILQSSPLYRQFEGCTSLKLYIAPNITDVGRLNYPFNGCTNIKGIFLPKANVGNLSLDIYHYNALFGGLSVKVVDVGNVTSLNEHTMRGSSSLTAFIIRNTTTIPTLTGETNASYFSNVTFYVDDNLLSTYQANSAWSNANIHLDVISNFVLSNHLDSDTLALYNSIINPS